MALKTLEIESPVWANVQALLADTTSSKRERLATLANMAAACEQCPLAEGRTRSVFSDGSPDAAVMLIGEGPGQNEDKQGIPFVGRSGKLLTQMLADAGFERTETTYICNIVKCRPPNNRAPVPVEMAACFSYLEAQIQIVRPRYLLLVGATAVKGILKLKTGISKLRGQWFDTPYEREPGQIIQAMPIFHPAYLLRNHSTNEGTPRWHMAKDLRMVKRVVESLD